MSDREDEMMDRLLTEASSTAVPDLSAIFDRNLAKALRPSRLNSRARFVMLLYAIAALAVSYWALRPLPSVWVFRIGFPCISFSLAWAFWRFWQKRVRQPACSRLQ